MRTVGLRTLSDDLIMIAKFGRKKRNVPRVVITDLETANLEDDLLQDYVGVREEAAPSCDEDKKRTLRALLVEVSRATCSFREFESDYFYDVFSLIS